MNQIRKIKKLLKTEFNRNVIVLMTGTTIAQAIPITMSPILTRIYSPDDFGVYALFVAVSAIFGSIANARYELAIMLPEKDEDAINIFALGFIINIFMSFMLLFFVCIFKDHCTSFLDNKKIDAWLYFIPLAVFFIGFWNLLNYFNNRKKNYKDISRAAIIKSIALSIIQISVGFVTKGATGLISGQIISKMFGNMRLFKNIIKDKVLLSKINKKKMLYLAKKYIDFPKFSMFAVLANSLSTHLTNILISTFYSLSILGYYSFIQRILGMPSSLIGGSIGQVFFQEASKEKEKTGKAIKTFNSTLKKLIIIGLPTFGILFFIIEELFAFVFGEEWRVAGTYAKILIPLFFIRFVVSPLTVMNQIYLKNKLGLYWQIGLMLTYLFTICFSSFLKLNFYFAIYLISFFVSFYYLFFLYLINSYIKKETQ